MRVRSFNELIFNVEVILAKPDICTVSNKKTHLADFETCVFRVYLRKPLSYKKVIYIYLHPCLKRFQIRK